MGLEAMTSAILVQCWCNAGAILVSLLSSFLPGKGLMNETNVYLKSRLSHDKFVVFSR